MNREGFVANLPSTRGGLTAIASIVLVLGIAAAFYMFAGFALRENALRNDFLGFYAAGVQVRERDGARLHDQNIQHQYQMRYEPASEEVVPFPRPRFYAEVFRPLAGMTREKAFQYWQAMQIVGMLGVWTLLYIRYRFEMLQITAFFYPLPIGIGHGQDTGWMAFLSAFSLYFWQGGSPGLAGAVLALSLFKWHLVALLPVAMLAGRQWRMCGGFSLVALILLAIDFALDGVAGWRSYVELLGRRDLDRMTPGIGFMPNVQGFFVNLGLPSLWWIGLVFVIGCFTICVWRLAWPQAMLAAQLAAVLSMPHAFQFDLAYMLFPLAALLALGPPGVLKWPSFLLLVPPIYFSTLFKPPLGGLVPLVELILLGGLAWHAYRGDRLICQVKLNAG